MNSELWNKINQAGDNSRMVLTGLFDNADGILTVIIEETVSYGTDGGEYTLYAYQVVFEEYVSYQVSNLNYLDNPDSLPILEEKEESDLITRTAEEFMLYEHELRHFTVNAYGHSVDVITHVEPALSEYEIEDDGEELLN